ncbi:MAG: DNRLRE domain-containing protein [candidate division Zixibacteria bacterium]|nr:DNRLRE domain-containing protein [candidate division Zixibacteria bacterium]
MKNEKTRFLAMLGITVVFVLVSVATVFAEEVRVNVGDAAFVPQLTPTGQNFEVFKFDLPEIPQGSRIDFAGLVLHVQRDSTRDQYLSLKLAPITSDWTITSLQNGQVLSVDEEAPTYAVADANRGDKIELDITQLVSAWAKGEKVNRGFLLKAEFPEELSKFSAKSNAGAKAELVIYYTGAEVKEAKAE